MVDTMVLVLSPGSGDQIQAMKSGIIETPDIFVINKADLPGADRVAGEIRSILHFRKGPSTAWRPRLAKVSADRGEGLADLSALIDGHQAWLAEHGGGPAPAQWRRQLLARLIARRAGDGLRALEIGRAACRGREGGDV